MWVGRNRLGVLAVAELQVVTDGHGELLPFCLVLQPEEHGVLALLGQPDGRHDRELVREALVLCSAGTK